MNCNIFRLAFLLSAHVIFTSCSNGDDSLVVETSCGRVRGRSRPVVHGLSVRQFLGIPYAQPPIGQLRFARPQPAKPWQGERTAVEFGFSCPQISMGELMNTTLKEEPQSEDCLSLNVYTPYAATAHDKKAVMVWIHGGGFTMGSGSQYNPSVQVALYDVIAVTINYRLGVLGFFNIPGTEIKGNYGMHDQVLALKWVQQNIEQFGGDPNKVTIYGESAGAMSVSVHLLSPLSKGLFRRVIAQSGSSAIDFTGAEVKSTKALEIFSKVMNCDVDDQLVRCVRDKNWTEILTGQRNVTYPTLVHDAVLTSVVMDGEFLPDRAKTLLREGKINRAEVMTGVTANEGALAALFGAQLFKDGIDQKTFEQMIRHGFPLTQSPNKLVEDATLFEYIDQSNPHNRIQNRQAFMDVTTDSMFIAPAMFEASRLAQANMPVYFYVFDHTPHLLKLPRWIGAVHGVDMFYTFGAPLSQEGYWDAFQFLCDEFTDLEVGFSQYTMQMWTNFAKHGDPNIGGSLPVTWPRYNSSGHVHLRISLEPKVEYSLREKKIAFWNEFVPKLIPDESSGSEKKKDERVKSEL